MNNNHNISGPSLKLVSGPQTVQYVRLHHLQSSGNIINLPEKQKTYRELEEDFREKSRRYENEKKENEELKKQLENTRQRLQTAEDFNRKLQRELTEKSQQYKMEKAKNQELNGTLMQTQQMQYSSETKILQTPQQLNLFNSIKEIRSSVDKKIVVTSTKDRNAHVGIFLGVFGDTLVMSESSVTKRTKMPTVKKMKFELSSITSIKKYFEQ